MAAAYAYHIIKNHSFIDGNKRTGITVAFVFLELNNINVEMTQDQFFELAIAIATSKLNKDQIAEILRRHTIPPQMTY